MGQLQSVPDERSGLIGGIVGSMTETQLRPSEAASARRNNCAHRHASRAVR